MPRPPALGDAQVLLVFEALETWMGTQRRGCAFVNAYAELGDSDHPAVPVIRAEKAWMRTLFDTLTGDVALGAHLHLLYEGTLVVLTAGADPRAAAEARRSVSSWEAQAPEDARQPRVYDAARAPCSMATCRAAPTRGRRHRLAGRRRHPRRRRCAGRGRRPGTHRRTGSGHRRP